jgi:citrate lyase subunit beta/citryl-CoA lyase
VAEPAHPREALFAGEKAPPALACCEHFAGSEDRIAKAFALQARLGPVFDISCDCEDGAPAGREKEHAQMVARALCAPDNRHRRAGARIHDPGHPAWRQDVEILVSGAGDALAYITVPKARSALETAQVIEHVERVAARHPAKPRIPIHVLIETHGALREVDQIAALPGLETLDFGLMDFVSAHHGAIPAAAMRSPGQFEHRLLVRAKTAIVAAALAHGLVPSHNVTLDLTNPRAAFDDARRARLEFGFLRMYSIHPVQVEPIIEAMRPNISEVRQAADILLAARDAGWGPVQHGGELHDRATYRYYWNVLERAKANGVALPEEAERAFF